MNEHMKYKGYTAVVSFSAEDKLLIGQIENIEALVLFSAESIPDLEHEFHAAVDSYIADCKLEGTEPEKPYKGSFNVRIGCDNHRRAAGIAKRLKISLNDVVKTAVEQFLDRQESDVAATIVQREVQMVRVGYVTETLARPSLQVGPAYPQKTH